MTDHNIPPARASRMLTAAEFHQLADVPPEVEWFANLTNAHTRREGGQDDARAAIPLRSLIVTSPRIRNQASFPPSMRPLPRAADRKHERQKFVRERQRVVPDSVLRLLRTRTIRGESAGRSRYVHLLRLDQVVVNANDRHKYQVRAAMSVGLKGNPRIGLLIDKMILYWPKPRTLHKEGATVFADGGYFCVQQVDDIADLPMDDRAF
jgi:hypothetical protein